MPLKDLDKLTVVKLRAELIARGLDSKGNKPFLVERLRYALEQEEKNGVVAPDIKMFASEHQIGDSGLDQESAEMDDEATGEAEQNSLESEPLPKGPNGTAEADKLNNGSHPTSTEVLNETEDSEKAPTDEPTIIKSDAFTNQSASANSDALATESSLANSDSHETESTMLKSETPDVAETLGAAEPKADETDSNLGSTPNDSVVAVYGGKDETYMEDSTLEQSADTTLSQTVQSTLDSATTDVDKSENCTTEESSKMEVSESGTNPTETGNSETTKETQDSGDAEAKVDAESAEVEGATKQEPTTKPERKGDRGSKRHRDRSSSPNHVHKKEEGPPPEDEPEWDQNLVILDWYNSDLNLVISKTDFASAHPLTDSGFAYMWAGVRATYGFTVGKLSFEVKVTENLSVPQLEESEPNHHVVRVGWSVDATTCNLGEDAMSFGYGGTGKISQNCEFKDFGVPFKLNDVVGVYLDASEDKEAVEISYTVNGESQGVAFTISKEELSGRPLFPHISTKNCRFEVNFGQKEEPWFQPLEGGYEWVSKVPVESRVRGAIAPVNRGECEMIMMCGLPGSGKTTWANKFCAENADRKFNILGTNAFLQKMKVNGLARRKNYTGRWEVLIEKCTRCLNILLDIAAKRRRNYILDQTNVYPTAQKRKMAYFNGFKRKAVVIVPNEEDAKTRWEKRIEEEGKDIPDSAVMDMKANFKVPSTDEIFSEVQFPELPREEALKVIEKYSTEAKAAGYGQPSPKRQRQSGSRRSDRDSRRRDGRDRNRDRSHRSSSSRYRDSRDDRHRPPPPSHWRGGPGRGGWSSRGPPPPPMSRNGPYSPRRGPPPPPGPMGGRGGWVPPPERPYPAGRPNRGYDDRRDRPPYSGPRRDVGPSPWMGSPSMAGAGSQRSAWGSQSWSGGMGGSSASSYGQPQQPAYSSAAYGGSPLYGSAATPRPAAGYSTSAGSVRPAPASYGASPAPGRPVTATYGGAGVTGLSRPASYGTAGPVRPAAYGTTPLPGSRPAAYGTNGSGARPTSYPAGAVGTWSQPQAQQQPQPQQTGYQYAYNPNHSTYSGGK